MRSKGNKLYISILKINGGTALAAFDTYTYSYDGTALTAFEVNSLPLWRDGIGGV